jgi:hypothetical protein
MKIRLAFIEFLHCDRRTDERTDLTKVTGAFLQFIVRRAPKRIGAQEGDAYSYIQI